MTALATAFRTTGAAALAGLQDYLAIFSARSWLAGWYVRVLAQVAFFALVGRVLGSEEQTRYLLVGNAVALVSIQALGAVNSTVWERRSGTLPLLVASPSPVAAVFLGRSLHWIPDGLTSSFGALLVVGPLFGLPLPWERVVALVPLVLLVGVSTYCFGLVLGALVLRATSLRNLVGNLAYTGMLALCGVNVPVGYAPAPVQAVANALPLTHGLRAVREVLAGGGFASVAGDVGAEALVGAAWLAVALVLFGRLAGAGRRDGSIEFG